MNWNRKYRPATIADLHLKSVRQHFDQLLTSGTVPQVMLFAGPKGTGKTSTARILGALLNAPENAEQIEYLFFKGKKPKKANLVSTKQDSPFFQQIYAGTSYVVQELDAASNRGIDDVRSLKERIGLPPQEGKMAVYILDEAHMLTTEAFNALLKLLEEPPAHVVFILATTELHKVPETIVSRAHLVQFRQASPEEITQALASIAQQEQVEYEPEALSLVARRSEGSFRDAVKWLEIVASKGRISLEQVESNLAPSLADDHARLLELIVSKNEAAVVELFENLRQRQVDPQFFHRSFLQYLHQGLLQAVGLQQGKPPAAQAVLLFLLTELSAASLSAPSPIPLLPLEVKILEIIVRAQKKTGATAKPASEPRASAVKKNSPEVVLTSEPEPKLDLVPSLTQPLPPLDSAADVGDGQLLCERWADFVNKVAEKNYTFAALLRSAQPLSGCKGQATITVYYKFHQEQLSESKRLALIHEAVEAVAGGPLQLTFVLKEPSPKAELTEVTDDAVLSELVQEVLG